MGAPISGSELDEWRLAAKAVSRRFINGYTRNDWILAFLFRVQTMNVKIAGLGKIEGLHGLVQSIDLTLVVNGHVGYRDKIDQAMANWGF